MDIDVSHWPAPLQYLAYVGAAIAGAVMWIIGNRGKPPPAPANGDAVRRDIEQVVEAVRVSAFNRIEQVEQALAKKLDTVQRDIEERVRDLEFERLRKVELDVADRLGRIEEQLKSLFRQRGAP